MAKNVVEFNGVKYDFGEKDWTKFQGRQPDSNHVLQAKVISELSGIEISAEQCMVFLAMHRMIQASQANQDRANFKGRTWESVLKGSATLAEKAIERQGPVVAKPIGARIEEEAAPEPAAKPKAPARRKPAAPTKAIEAKPETAKV